MERQINELYAKQGRSVRFTSKKERDAWIKREIKTLNQTISAQEQQVNLLSQNIPFARFSLALL